MLDTATKRRIDTARDILVGKVPDPKSHVDNGSASDLFRDTWDFQQTGAGGSAFLADTKIPC